jgi:hypothetical protein
MLIQATSSLFLPRGIDIYPTEMVIKGRGIDYGGGGVLGRFDDSLIDRLYGDPADRIAARELIERAIRKGGAHVVGSVEVQPVRPVDRTLPALEGADRPIQQKRAKVAKESVSDTFAEAIGD